VKLHYFSRLVQSRFAETRFAETRFAETRFAETRFAETPTLTLTLNPNFGESGFGETGSLTMLRSRHVRKINIDFVTAKLELN